MKPTLLAALSFIATVPAVAADGHSPSTPQKTDDGWVTAELTDEGIGVTPINELLDRIRDNTYKNIHAVLLVRNGRLVLEEYYAGQQEDGRHRVFSRDTLHEIHSATKSINSILIGIAIDKHLISGVDQKISNFFPEYNDVFSDGKRDLICLKHLLSMTAGLSWDEWTYPYSDARNDHVAMNNSQDPIRYVLE